MSKNVYDIFRDVQEKRSNTYNQRSAALIIDGKMSKTIYHKRNDKNINAALLFSQDEGPDDVWVFSFIKDDLQKGDYFTFEDTSYLILEENKIFDPDINHKKQKAVECNVSFTYNNTIYNGYYKSQMRRTGSQDFEDKQYLMPDEKPLLILPSNNNTLTINDEFSIEGKPFKVFEFDSISNKGLVYYYLERGFTRNETEEEVQSFSLSFISPEEEFTQEPEPMLFARSAAPEESNEEALKPMVEYNFSTEGAYFSATPKVEVLRRTKTSIKFKIPFGINQVSIATRSNGIVVEKFYRVDY